ncbi:MAG: hypothetical protein FWD62_10170 [Betaproteobacteria bacterium]|nr:hypothetical protein [Betaproteobacteria bacterium]
MDNKPVVNIDTSPFFVLPAQGVNPELFSSAGEGESLFDESVPEGLFLSDRDIGELGVVSDDWDWV